MNHNRNKGKDRVTASLLLLLCGSFSYSLASAASTAARVFLRLRPVCRVLACTTSAGARLTKFSLPSLPLIDLTYFASFCYLTCEPFLLGFDVEESR